MIIAYSPCHDTYLHGQDQFHLVKKWSTSGRCNIGTGRSACAHEHGEKVAVHVQDHGDFRCG